jgi:hypothetical protein
VQKQILISTRKTYPESILFEYSHFQIIYLFSKLLIDKDNTDLSTKKSLVNYYYYLYI